MNTTLAALAALALAQTPETSSLEQATDEPTRELWTFSAGVETTLSGPVKSTSAHLLRVDAFSEDSAWRWTGGGAFRATHDGFELYFFELWAGIGYGLTAGGFDLILSADGGVGFGGGLGIGRSAGVRARADIIFPLPNDLSLEVGASYGMTMVALQSERRAIGGVWRDLGVRCALRFDVPVSL